MKKIIILGVFILVVLSSSVFAKECREGLTQVSDDLCLSSHLVDFTKNTNDKYYDLSKKYFGGNLMAIPIIIFISLMLYAFYIKNKSKEIIIEG